MSIKILKLIPSQYVKIVSTKPDFFISYSKNFLYVSYLIIDVVLY